MKINSFLNKETITGSVIGAIAGSVVSTKFHKEHDKPVRKATKTGLFAAAGYLLGGLIESWFRKK
jgi:hypothetical protein